LDTVNRCRSLSHRGESAADSGCGFSPYPPINKDNPHVPSHVRAGGLGGWKALEGLSYVQAVLWLGARLAEGLAHAHERGILHRDLKAATVPLGDDGQHQRLEFHVA